MESDISKSLSGPGAELGEDLHRRFHPWWLWPNLLSLDAPVVALVWLAFLSHRLHAGVSWHLHAGLALAVWVIYSGDRLLDAVRIPEKERASARHRFHDDHRGAIFWIIAMAVVLGAVVAAPQAMHSIHPGAFLLLAPAVAGYFLMIHGLQGQRWSFMVKEAACGLLFAWGTSLALAGRVPWSDWLITVGVFGSVCALNCINISCWEREVDTQHDSWSVAVRFPGTMKLLPWIHAAVVVIPLGLLLSGWHWEISGAAISAVVGLWAVNVWRSRMPDGLARVLADFVLLTPLLFPW